MHEVGGNRPGPDRSGFSVQAFLSALLFFRSMQTLGATSMLDKLTSEEFAPFINHSWELVSVDGTTVETVLTSVREVPSARGPAVPARRMPFNLVFQGPADTPLGDGLYTLMRDTHKVPGIFLTRIQHHGTEPASKFQAVFN